MKRVAAQFRSPWRPGRGLLAALAVLSVLTLVAVGGVAWEQQRAIALRAQVAQLMDADRAGAMPLLPHSTPPYDVSARQFLSERAADWAPMLRTLENGAMVGVTPSAVEFNAADGVARVTLNYADSTALFDYLGRINEGVSPGQGLARWTLVDIRMQPSALTNPASTGPAMSQMGVTQSVATIRSVWKQAAPPSSQGRQ
jgi:hypothetical protein